MPLALFFGSFWVFFLVLGSKRRTPLRPPPPREDAKNAVLALETNSKGPVSQLVLNRLHTKRINEHTLFEMKGSREFSL